VYSLFNSNNFSGTNPKFDIRVTVHNSYEKIC